MTTPAYLPVPPLFLGEAQWVLWNPILPISVAFKDGTAIGHIWLPIVPTAITFTFTPTPTTGSNTYIANQSGTNNGAESIPVPTVTTQVTMSAVGYTTPIYVWFSNIAYAPYKGSPVGAGPPPAPLPPVLVNSTHYPDSSVMTISPTPTVGNLVIIMRVGRTTGTPPAGPDLARFTGLATLTPYGYTTTPYVLLAKLWTGGDSPNVNLSSAGVGFPCVVQEWTGVDPVYPIGEYYADIFDANADGSTSFFANTINGIFPAPTAHSQVMVTAIIYKILAPPGPTGVTWYGNWAAVDSYSGLFIGSLTSPPCGKNVDVKEFGTYDQLGTEQGKVLTATTVPAIGASATFSVGSQIYSVGDFVAVNNAYFGQITAITGLSFTVKCIYVYPGNTVGQVIPIGRGVNISNGFFTANDGDHTELDNAIYFWGIRPATIVSCPLSQ